MLNWVWLGLILGSVSWAATHGRMPELNEALLDSARSAIELVVGLLGPMVFFLGVMNIARDAGLLDRLSRVLAPLMRRLFPEVPTDHPAMGAMILNIAANMLGLGNAATPFGVKAMVELGRLNRERGAASNSMVLFLAINTSSVTLLPLGTIAVREAAGSVNPAAIIPTTWVATLASTLAAVTAALLLRRWYPYRADVAPLAAPEVSSPTSEPEEPEGADAPRTKRAGPALRRTLQVVWLAIAAGLVWTLVAATLDVGFGEALKQAVSTWLLPLLVAALVSLGALQGVPVYESAVRGGREGLEVAVRIAPFLVIILVAVAAFRASGALPFLVGLLDLPLGAVGVPAEALPMALLRPLTASGAFGVMSEILESQGPDSFVGLLVSTLMGSTETTFYVLAVYLGAARVRDARHSLPACLVGDLVGFVAAVGACHLLFGGLLRAGGG